MKIFLEELTVAKQITPFSFNSSFKSGKARIYLLIKEFNTILKIQSFFFFSVTFSDEYFYLLCLHNLSPEVHEVKLSVVLT